MKPLIKWFRKKTETIEYNRFLVTIKADSQFLIRYPKKDYTPKIGECLCGNWTKTINVIKQKILFIDIYLNNQKRIKDLCCEIKIEELNEHNEIIHPTHYSFTVGTEIEKLKWTRFKIKSVLD